MRLFKVNAVLLILVLLSLSSCNRQRTVSIPSMKPAAINVPPHIQNLVIVNRTKLKSGIINVIEGALTGELPGQDKAAVQAGMMAFQRAIEQSPRFNVKIATEELEGNSITAALPDPLNWGQVQRLANKYGADGILVLETYDSDFVVTNGKKRVTKKIKEGDSFKEVEVDEFFAEGLESVKVGYRLYDPSTRTIVDQDQFKRTNTFRATGSTVTEAAAALISKNEAARRVTEMAMNGYAHKIAPMPITLRRNFYARSKKVPAIERGARYAEVQQWREAAETWEQAVSTAPDKEAGRLAYNIAIAHEVIGDMEGAKSWAQRAFVEFGCKKARNYIQILDQRLMNEDIVNQQMGN